MCTQSEPFRCCSVLRLLCDTTHLLAMGRSTVGVVGTDKTSVVSMIPIGIFNFVLSLEWSRSKSRLFSLKTTELLFRTQELASLDRLRWKMMWRPLTTFNANNIIPPNQTVDLPVMLCTEGIMNHASYLLAPFPNHDTDEVSRGHPWSPSRTSVEKQLLRSSVLVGSVNPSHWFRPLL